MNMEITNTSILVELPRGVPSEYYLVTLGNVEYYCDAEGLVSRMASWYGEGHHPAYTSEWVIKRFDRKAIALTDVPVSKIVYFAHEATKLYLKGLVDKKLS